MLVKCYDSEFDVPDLLIDKFYKDFDCLPGSGRYQDVASLRDSTDEIVEVIAEEPDLLEEPEYMADFLRALAIRKALEKHGILYDA